MYHKIFGERQQSYETVILIKESSLDQAALVSNYIHPLSTRGIDQSSLIAFSLGYDAKGKAPVKLIKEYCGVLLKALTSKSIQAKTLYVADANYFKVLTGQRKTTGCMGYVYPCKIKGYEHLSVILGVNHSSLFYNPNNQTDLDMSLDTLATHMGGVFEELGKDIVHSERYLASLNSIKEYLTELLAVPSITADIEAFSLKHYSAGIGTIGFATDKHNGAVIQCDYVPYDSPQTIEVWDKKDDCFKKREAFGYQVDNQEVKAILRWFFETYKGNIKWHNASYDIKVIIYELWMEGDITNHVGLLKGLEIMTRNFDCTRLITYLSTNSCAGNKLSLKDQAHEFAGNYAQDEINDIRLIPLDKLAPYNLVDCLCTWYVYEKYYDVMVRDNQEDLYEGLFKESLITIIQMELTGMPMSMDAVKKGKAELQAIHDKHSKAIQESPLTKRAIILNQEAWIEKDYLSRKEKNKNPDAVQIRTREELEEKSPATYKKVSKFNPNSGKQIAILLHEVIGLPIIETTDTGLPAADDDTLKALKNHTNDEQVIALIEDIRGQLGVDKILSTFIPAFEQAQLGKDGIHYLFGCFNLGGTKSGRLSSSNPNMQNIPSGSTYAKVVKKMFKGNADWLFSGADFASLEDYISALTTKDPMKLKVYLDGYDGHSLRAFSYFREEMPDIEDTVESINSIKKHYDPLRSKSKAPTFLLTYGGSYHGLMKNCGFSEEEAKRIEANYHDLYKVSDEWVQERLVEASKTGYVEVAFGLRLRTPLLNQVVLNTSSTPYEAAAEGRTAGNALGQSYGLLNCRAANEFMQRVRKSKHKYDIKICAQIHDAIYLIIRNELEIIEWANRNLTECMSWQELPEIQHDKVKIHAELDLFPNWATPLTLPADASMEDIYLLAKEFSEKNPDVLFS